MAGDERDDERAHEQDGAPPQGSMRFQDETTRPREPTLAERKAREQAERRQREADEQAEADAERSRTRRKRILIGAGVTVGLAAVIAVGYAIAQPDDEVTARCVDDSGVVVDDANCVTPAASNSHYYGGGFYPIFIGAGGAQYHYNYGGNGSIGQPVSGGTTTVPRDTTRVTTPSGKSVSGSSGGSSGTVSRGGLGSSSSGSSSGS
jgi:hypothetical protein